MKLILVIFLVYIIVGIYSQTDKATNSDLPVDKNANDLSKNDTKVNRTARNYSNHT
jgi:hypothetical protein